VGVQRHAPAALTPGKRSSAHCSRLGGPWGRPGWIRKISPSPELEARIVRPKASRCTDKAI